MIDVKGYRVLVKPDTVDLKTPTGIIIAADKKIEQSGQQYGTLVSVGERAWEGYTPYAEIGQRVLYSQYAGKVVHDPETGVGYVIMNDEDVLAVVHAQSTEQSLDDVISALDDRRESI